jgi:hypothetical protein
MGTPPHPLFPVHHEPPEAAGADDVTPWERFAGRHEGAHYCDVGSLAPVPGQSLIRRCKCGTLYRWEGSHWCPVTGLGRWRLRRFLVSDAGWFSDDGPHDWGLSAHRLRRFLLRLRGWDA